MSSSMPAAMRRFAHAFMAIDMRCARTVESEDMIDDTGCCYHRVERLDSHLFELVSSRRIAATLMRFETAVPEHFRTWAPPMCLICNMTILDADEHVVVGRDAHIVCHVCAESMRNCASTSTKRCCSTCTTGGRVVLTSHQNRRMEAVHACIDCLVRGRSLPAQAAVRDVCARTLPARERLYWRERGTM